MLQKTSWLLIENSVVSESLQSQKTFAKDIPGLFNVQETVHLTSTDLACRYRILERLQGKSNGQHDQVVHSWADDVLKNSCLIWYCCIFFGQVYEVCMYLPAREALLPP